jgi:hypothetical protein
MERLMEPDVLEPNFVSGEQKESGEAVEAQCMEAFPNCVSCEQ